MRKRILAGMQVRSNVEEERKNKKLEKNKFFKKRKQSGSETNSPNPREESTGSLLKGSAQYFEDEDETGTPLSPDFFTAQ